MVSVCARVSRFNLISKSRALAALVLGILAGPGVVNGQTNPPSPYLQWTNGPSADAYHFPIAVWLQNPANAARYRAAGFSLYIGLWQGPTEAQLAAMEPTGIRVICEQNSVGLKHKNDPLIAGWLQADEPDNSQWMGRFGPPTSPEAIQNRYAEMRAADPTRPVLLNLGQGVAWNNYNGRGLRRNHPEDYPRYIKGCDIASFDIYPVVHTTPEIAGKLEYVAAGVGRLVQWSQGKPVWNCIECTHINNSQVKPTPAQVRTEVWMSLIHGSCGLIYFAHQFKPDFKEAALLDDPEMLAAVTAINRQIQELAPVLNSPTIPDGATIQSSAKTAPIACIVKRHGNTTWLFAVCMSNHAAQASFKVRDLPEKASADALGESRELPVRDGGFEDEFKAYEVHLYRIQVSP